MSRDNIPDSPDPYTPIAPDITPYDRGFADGISSANCTRADLVHLEELARKYINVVDRYISVVQASGHPIETGGRTWMLNECRSKLLKALRLCHE